jgi:hypothetical protein
LAEKLLLVEKKPKNVYPRLDPDIIKEMETFAIRVSAVRIERRAKGL